MYAGYRSCPPSSAVCWQLNVLGQEIMQPVRWLLFCQHRANTVEQSAWTASATRQHLQTIQTIAENGPLVLSGISLALAWNTTGGEVKARSDVPQRPDVIAVSTDDVIDVLIHWQGCVQRHTEQFHLTQVTAKFHNCTGDIDSISHVNVVRICSWAEHSRLYFGWVYGFNSNPFSKNNWLKSAMQSDTALSAAEPLLAEMLCVVGVLMIAFTVCSHWRYVNGKE